jgi:hypothetical protein
MIKVPGRGNSKYKDLERSEVGLFNEQKKNQCLEQRDFPSNHTTNELQ